MIAFFSTNQRDHDVLVRLDTMLMVVLTICVFNQTVGLALFYLGSPFVQVFDWIVYTYTTGVFVLMFTVFIALFLTRMLLVTQPTVFINLNHGYVFRQWVALLISISTAYSAAYTLYLKYRGGRFPTHDFPPWACVGLSLVTMLVSEFTAKLLTAARPRPQGLAI